MVFVHTNSEILAQTAGDKRPVYARGSMAQPSTSWTQETTAVIIHSRSHEGFTSIRISPLEAQFHVDDFGLDIPTLVGLPLWMRHHSWTGPRGDELEPSSEVENENARRLCVNANAEGCNFLTAPLLRGDRLVARKDGKDLWTQHLVCLGAFCNAIVQEFVRAQVLKEEGAEEGRDLRRLERNATMGEEMAARERGMRFRSMASRAGFQNYWERWCRKKFGASGEAVWKGMKGPYDM